MLPLSHEVRERAQNDRPPSARRRARGVGAAVEGVSDLLRGRLSDGITTTTWSRLHDPAEPMFVLGAYLGGKLVGIVHSLYHRSCWTIGNYCYLQNYLSPRKRAATVSGER